MTESTMKTWTPLHALLVLLDSIDFTRGACKPTEMIGALVSVDILLNAREAAVEAMRHPDAR